MKFVINMKKHGCAAFRSQSDAQRTGIIVGDVMNARVGFLFFLQHPASVCKVDLAGLCRAQLIFAAVKQRHAEFFFQF